MEPGVSIVIPTWNGLSLLERFLPSVIAAATHYRQQALVPAEIVIVDDASTDGTPGWLERQGFKEAGHVTGNRLQETARSEEATWESGVSFRLVINETNAGFGESCNRGFALARYRLVFLLNNDVEVACNSIRPLVENFRERSVFAAHCRVFDLESGRECGTGKLGSFSRGFIRVHRSYVPASVEEQRTREGALPLYSMFAGGGSAMFDRDKFLSMGGFDRLLAPFYWEDVELSYRAWKRGFCVVYEPGSVTRHRVSSTTGRLDRKRVERVQQRNRIVYHWIHLHDRRMFASHLMWSLLLAITAPLRLQTGLVAACVSAVRLLPAILERRREEKRAAKRRDSEIFSIFDQMERSAGVIAYDGYAQLKRLQDEHTPSG